MYVAARVWDSAPPSEWVANEMRRDTVQLRQNDNFGVLFDTYYDHRNGFFFYTTPLGALADQQFTNEGNPNQDWNPVWDVRTGRFEGGWTVEMEIPFKSLRYRSAPTQLWGLQLRRLIRRKNEHVYLTPVPISLGPSGVYRVSGAATLVGLQVPGTGRNLEIKPYGVGGVSTDLEAEPPRRNDGNGDFGVDVKFGVTQSPDRRPDLQHRLCAGRGRRATGQPDAASVCSSLRNASSSWRAKASSSSLRGAAVVLVAGVAVAAEEVVSFSGVAVAAPVVETSRPCSSAGASDWRMVKSFRLWQGVG